MGKKIRVRPEELFRETIVAVLDEAVAQAGHIEEVIDSRLTLRFATFLTEIHEQAIANQVTPPGAFCIRGGAGFRVPEVIFPGTSVEARRESPFVLEYPGQVQIRVFLDDGSLKIEKMRRKHVGRKMCKSHRDTCRAPFHIRTTMKDDLHGVLIHDAHRATCHVDVLDRARLDSVRARLECIDAH